jgi:hypothetical protein
MVQSGAVVKTKIEKRIFSSPPGTTITIYPVTKSAEGSYGGYSGQSEEYNEYDKVVTIGVPYGFISNDRNYMSFGLSAEGETRMAVSSNENFKQGDRIIMSTNPKVKFKILKIQEYPYDDVNLANILTIKQDISEPLDTETNCDSY